MDPKNIRLKLIPFLGKSILLLTCIFIPIAVFSEIPISIIEDGQLFPTAVSDRSGGAVIMWEDYRTGNDWDVYTQRINNEKTLLWDQKGVPISVADRNQRRLRMVGYDTHTIVVWNDRRRIRSWDIFAQAIDLEGKVLWETDGIPICIDDTDQSTQAILADGEGGAIIVWEDERRSSEFQDLYIQRVDSQGNILWKKDGITVFESDSSQSEPILSADGLGGFYIIWWDVIGYDNWHIMAHRYNIDGTPIWDSPILISPTDGMQGIPRVVSDNENGIIVVWQIYENFINDQIYAQRINPNGDKQWKEEGVPICTADGIQKNHAIVEDGSGGIIVVWRDERDIYGDLYMQRISADGTIIWKENGIPLCTAGGHQDRPYIVNLDDDTFFISWVDFRGDVGEKTANAIYCQKIDISGNILWDKDGVPVSTSKGEHYPPFVVSIGNGECMVVWSNSGRDNGDIFLKRF
ncbi:hypothetical protein C6497_16345 [Candidatus Poribacteria bacterium]|nr:MAG: hypothetical protein C6497_16345 [Candidatus Poribacteria bacterium]